MDQPQIVPHSEAQTPAPQHDYHSFLLRLWLVPDGEQVQWRASLEDVQSGELRGFIKLKDLLGYLEGLTEPRQSQEISPGSAAPEGEVGVPPS